MKTNARGIHQREVDPTELVGKTISAASYRDHLLGETLVLVFTDGTTVDVDSYYEGIQITAEKENPE